jgi:hypothetical protein
MGAAGRRVGLPLLPSRLPLTARVFSAAFVRTVSQPSKPVPIEAGLTDQVIAALLEAGLA